MKTKTNRRTSTPALAETRWTKSISLDDLAKVTGGFTETNLRQRLAKQPTAK